MADFKVTHLDEIEATSYDPPEFRPVRLHFGISTFGIIAGTARKAGDRLISEHDESEPDSSEELYVVTSGQARFELDGEERDAPAGTFVYVPAGIKRTAFAETAGTTVLAIGAAAPGKVYEADGWEMSWPLMALFKSGAYEEGAERANALLEDNPTSGHLYYNTACFESRAGRIDAALAHLRRGIELRPQLTQLARTDEDLAAIREHPGFKAIVCEG